MLQKPQTREYKFTGNDHFSGVHSIMLVNLAQPREVGGCTPPPPPLSLSTTTSKVVVYALAERADTLLLFLIYPFLLDQELRVI
jgi:hypothetical protein